MKLTDQQFASIWQSSSGIEEVCLATDLGIEAVKYRSRKLRERGVPLKSYRPSTATYLPTEEDIATIKEELKQKHFESRRRDNSEWQYTKPGGTQ